MLSGKKIKRKIRSVNNIKKITRAMEMVSAAKLKKVQARLNAIRPFAAKLQTIVENLLTGMPQELITHPLLRPVSLSRENLPQKKTIAITIIASNKGLCGGYNANLLKTAGRFIQENPETNIKIMALGKKVIDYFQRQEFTLQTLTGTQGNDPERALVYSHPQIPPHIDSHIARDIISPFLQEYEKGMLDEIWVVYTEFVNALVHRPRVKRLVPLSGTEKPKNERTEEQSGSSSVLPYGYLFEPEPKIILNLLVPRYIEITFYRLLLDTLASEHSARMIAMRNATDNASEVVDELTLIFNKARQASITKELLDIVGGAEAMK